MAPYLFYELADWRFRSTVDSWYESVRSSRNSDSWYVERQVVSNQTTKEFG